ncbi:MAG: hypothetical protein WBO36_01800, partial [Saprospiraceae bacterium]
MKLLTTSLQYSLSDFDIDFKLSTTFLLSLALTLCIFNNAFSQSYFSPNPAPVFEQHKMDAFIKATPEITLKAEYYNVSKAVLETILVLQSNSGSIISDGSYNYSRVLPNAGLNSFSAFSNSKNGFILCSTRSRGVEATALSMSILRNAGKTSMTEAQWLTLVFGPGGDLDKLA